MILKNAIHFWDMDHTIINNDCDVSWKNFLVEEGLASADAQEKADYFYQQYCEGCLDDKAFMEFQLEEFRGRNEEEMLRISQRHFESWVKKTIYPQAVAMIEEQIQNGETVILLTATNYYVAKPVADYLGIETIVATDLELQDGLFSGRTRGIYCCAEGKLQRLQEHCRERGFDESRVAYYGDSRSDIAVLENVAFPFAVNPVDVLRELAQAKPWPIFDFKS
jgi:HAD superfamily hydrolase (TIGR01490 family)